MLNYKELYLKLFRASEEAANILIAAQQAREELYISRSEPKLTLVPLPSAEKQNRDAK